MVFPIIPLAIAGMGIGAGFGAGSWLSKGKKEIHAAKEHYAPTTHTVSPYAHYHPRLQFAPVSSYAYQGSTYIIDSPGATSKKEQTVETISKPTADFGAIDYPVDIAGSRRTGEGGTGTNIMHLAIIGAVVLVAVTVIGKKKKGSVK